jgi:hypothetical protein
MTAVTVDDVTVLHLHLFSFRRSNQFPVWMDIKHVTYYKFVMTTHHLSIDLLGDIIRPLTNSSSCQIKHMNRGKNYSQVHNLPLQTHWQAVSLKIQL